MKTLFCIIGNLRGGDLPYQSFVDTFGDKVDLALCVGNTYKESKYRNIAKYIWEINEANDKIWESIYNKVSTKWKTFDHTMNLWGPYNGLPGSGMIICGFRQILLQKLMGIPDIEKKYDRFVLSRSDHIYVNDFLPTPEDNHIYVPEGQEYKGITDRFIVGKYSEFIKGLNLINFIQNRPNLCHNVECYIMHFYESIGIHIVKYQRNMFTVARLDEQTRWKGCISANQSPLSDHDRLPKNKNYVYKYKSEFDLIESYKNISS